jgi:hypothetical protein
LTRKACPHDDVDQSSGGWQDEWDEGDDEAWQESSELSAQYDRALISRTPDDLDAWRHSLETRPLIVPGDGVSMGAPFIRRRERPLTMRIIVLALMAAVLATGIFAITPMGGNTTDSISAFQAIAGSVVWQKSAGYSTRTGAAGIEPRAPVFDGGDGVGKTDSAG